LEKEDCMEIANILLEKGYIKAKEQLTSFRPTKKYFFNLSTDDALIMQLNNTPPELIVHKPSEHSILQFRADNFARQLTYFEFNLFRKIQFYEWNYWVIGDRSKRDQNAPNLQLVINFVNKVSSWVATEIITTPNPKQRKDIVKHVISIAQYCLKYKNYSGVLELITGLNMIPVQRLKSIWKISKKYLEMFQVLSKLISPEENWKIYRPLINNEKPPFVPYIGLYLADLTFINDGNPSKLEDGKINWLKARRFAAILQHITTIQQFQYTDLAPQPEVQMFLAKELYFLAEEELYKKSLAISPRRARTDSA